MDIKGWKTKTAGVLGILIGLLSGAMYFIGGADATGALPPGDAMMVITGGLAVVGLGDKLSKLTATIVKLLEGKK
jgi:hypothetical protein